MKINWTYTGLVELLLLIGCTEVNADKDEEAQKLMNLSRKWSAVASTGNIDSLMTYWAEDALMMAPGQPPLRGREAIRSFVEASSKIPGFEVSWEHINIHLSNDDSMAYMKEKNQIAFNDFLGNRVMKIIKF